MSAYIKKIQCNDKSDEEIQQKMLYATQTAMFNLANTFRGKEFDKVMVCINAFTNYAVAAILLATDANRKDLDICFEQLQSNVAELKSIAEYCYSISKKEKRQQTN